MSSVASAANDDASLVRALESLQSALSGVALPLEVPGVEQQRRMQAEMLGQLGDYVLPRLRQIDAPLLTVVGGSTGAGKSTLVNSVLGRRVSQPGVLRPTTRSAVLVFNPDDRAWFDSTRILPELTRTTSPSTDARSLQLVADGTVPAGLAVLDAPDIDSVEQRNRALAAQLLAAADLWLFVTSAARYADQVPWDFLHAAADRSTAVAVVLDRIPAGAAHEVEAHLRQMLDERGLEAARLFSVEESPLGADGLLPDAAVLEVRGWLQGLAADAQARGTVVRQTLHGAVRSLARRSQEVAVGHRAQVELVARLRADVDAAYADALQEVSAASADGSLLRGEVLARWQEFVGTGELFRSLESRVGWLRDRIAGWATGKPAQADRVSGAVESGLESLLLEHAEAAAERTARSWASVEAGRRLLEQDRALVGAVVAEGVVAPVGPGGSSAVGTSRESTREPARESTREPGPDLGRDPGRGVARDLGRASRDFRARAERTVRDWQAGVLGLVRSEGADRRTTARFLAFGLNGLSVALMIVVFASTAGLTGAEVGIAGGSAVLGQKLLEAVFGDQAVRRLAEQARADLERRAQELYADEAARFHDLLDQLQLDPAGTAQLTDAARELDASLAGTADGAA